MDVQIISRKLIKPSLSTPQYLRNMKISFFDQLAPPIYVTTIFYYPANGDNHEMHIQLEKSLSETLTLFYPLAGRYIGDNLLIDCNGQGVEYLEAKVNGQLSQLLCGEPNVELLSRLVPNQRESATSPLVAIQVNMFECGGLAIGVCTSHRITDTSTTTTFMEGWSCACRGRINEVICPSFDLASHFPARELSELNLQPPRTKKAKIVTKVFLFDKAAISKLKDKARGGDHARFKCQASRVQAVTALIWRALIGAARARHGYLRASLLSHVINLRGKTSLSIPENSCGNLYGPALARFMPDESKLELNHLVGLLGDAIRNGIAEWAKAPHGDDGFSMIVNSYKELYEEMNKGEVDGYVFSSWCRFPLYETNLGWGKPTWVSTAHSPVQMVVLMDTKCGGGIEAWVSLEEETMHHFQQDPDMLP